MIMKTLSRITAILFQLGTIKVTQLAINTVILSRVSICRLGPLTVTHQTRNKMLLFCSVTVVLPV